MRENEFTLAREADQEFAIIVKNANGVLMDLSSAAELLIVIYGADKTILGAYAGTVSGDFDQQINNDLAEFGELRIKVHGPMTAAAELQKYYYELRAIWTDGTFDGGTDDKIITQNYLFTLVDSVTNSMTW